MLSLSLTAGYGILALSCLDGERWMLARELAVRTGVPKPYLSKILHALARAQLIRAKRGYLGGFMLARRAEEIMLLDIVDAVDGTAWAGRCLLGLAACSDERACPMHEFWKSERASIRGLLARTSLQDVAQFEDRRRRGAERRGDGEPAAQGDATQPGRTE